MRRVFGFAVAVLLAGWVRAGLADEPLQLTSRQSEIVATVLSAQDGYITRELYDEFWRSLPPEGGGRAEMSALLQNLLRPTEAYVRATWASALLSFRARQYVLSDDYAEAKAHALDNAHRLIGTSAAPMELAVQKSERFIRNAADHGNYETEGRKVLVTEDLLLNTISGIDGSLDRMALLTAAEWQASDREILLEDVSLRALLPWRLARSTSTEELENGLKITMISYSGALDANRYLNLGFADFGLPKFNVRGALFGATRQGLQGVGLTLVGKLALERWQGLESVAGTGAATIDGKPVAGSVRGYYVPGRTGISLIVVIVEGSVADLMGALNDIEPRLAVVP